MAILQPDFEIAEIIQPGGRPLPAELEARIKPYYIQNGDVRLRVLYASAATDAPRGSIIFSPGRGFNVLMVDPRGQGLSDRLTDDPMKSYVEDFQNYADDLAFALDSFGPLMPKPHIAMGHSMGGTIVLKAVISGVLNPAAVVCSAPMLGLFDLEMPLMRGVIVALAMLGLDKRNLPFQVQRNGLPVPFNINKLTSDRERYRIWASYFQTTPRLRVGPPTYGWIRAALRAMAQVNRNADKLRVPSLMLGAGGDAIVDPASIEKFAEKSGSEYQVIPAAQHELFLERDQYRDEAFAAIDAFLETQKL